MDAFTLPALAQKRHWSPSGLPFHSCMI